jgi:hypothetical protein
MIKEKEAKEAIDREEHADRGAVDYSEQEQLRRRRLAAARSKKYRKCRATPGKVKTMKTSINIVLGDCRRIHVDEETCIEDAQEDGPGPSSLHRMRRGKTTQRKHARLSKPRADRERKVRNMSYA